MDINYDELFGVESEKTEDVAETPAAETVETAEAQTAEESAGAKESEPAEQTEQTKEERAQHAAARRKAEEDARVRKGVDDAIASLGLTNPYTGKAVQNRADFDEYNKATSKEKKDAFLDKTGVSEDDLNKFIEELPEYREMKAMKADMERQRQISALNEAIAEVTKIDPSVKTLEDLQKQANYREIYQYVLKGISIPEAYKLANFDKLTTARASSAAKQAALNNLGKSHLTTTQSRGEGSIEVPADVMAQYKLFNPKATDAEIQAHYNKHHKKG